jgi:membrane-bound lytic murein transglycosylase MltF
MLLRSLLLSCLVSPALILSACSQSKTQQAAQQADQASEAPSQQGLGAALQSVVGTRRGGDLDAMIKRRVIRVAAPFNRTFFFIDEGVPRGLAYEYLKLFEEELNTSRGKDSLPIHLVFLALPRDMLLPALESGRVDMVVAQLTITPERLSRVDFTNPTRTGVNEIVVTGPGGPAIASIADLSGKRLFVRRSSSYFESLQEANRRLAAAGRPPIRVEEAPESLEDDDLLEMVNAGLIQGTVVDDFVARFWKQVFTGLVLHEQAPLRTGARLGVAIRKQSPKLATELNGFISRHGLDTTLGRILTERYLQSTKYVVNAAASGERRKFLDLVELFRRYGKAYDLDYLLMAAQGYQESRLEQDRRSPAGAIGVMQIKPETGQEQGVGDIRGVDANVHAGVKYMRFMLDRYYADEPMDRLNKGLFTFASYNAGPARIRKLRREAAERGLDPNVWFGNVEQIASERIGRETVTYVSNIYKYYIAYRLISEQTKQRETARTALSGKAR